MSLRITPERYDVPVLMFLSPLIWVVACLILWLVGCAAMDTRGADSAGLKIQLAQRDAVITGLKVQLEDVKVQVAATIDESASPITTAGDNATITNISFGSAGGMALMLGLLAWRHRTAVGALDRVMDVIEDCHAFAKRNTSPDNHEIRHHAEAITEIKRRILNKGMAYRWYCNAPASDRHERCIQSRLARMKKP